jgi:hypothetical protein
MYDYVGYDVSAVLDDDLEPDWCHACDGLGEDPRTGTMCRKCRGRG